MDQPTCTWPQAHNYFLKSHLNFREISESPPILTHRAQTDVYGPRVVLGPATRTNFHGDGGAMCCQRRRIYVRLMFEGR